MVAPPVMWPIEPIEVTTGTSHVTVSGVQAQLSRTDENGLPKQAGKIC
jgi:hypothetical protein